MGTALLLLNRRFFTPIVPGFHFVVSLLGSVLKANLTNIPVNSFY